MKIIDSDLISIQEARILVENAVIAKEALLGLSQEELDFHVNEVLVGLEDFIEDFAKEAFKETDYGIPEDEIKILKRITRELPEQLKINKLIGYQNYPCDNKKKIGVPKGIVVSLAPSWLNVSTVILNVITAIKTGNPIIVSSHMRAKNSTFKVMDKICGILKNNLYPTGGVDFLKNVTDEGEKVLYSHSEVSFVIENNRLHIEKVAGKEWFKASIGNNPVFVEKNADLKIAAQNIIESKTFFNGLLPGVEQSIVAEKDIDEKFRAELITAGAHFLSKDEEDRLEQVIFSNEGLHRPELFGKSAVELAKRADIRVSSDTKILVIVKPYVSRNSPYSGEKYAPIISYFVEDNWMHACEKCIELILNEQLGHSLSVYSKDDYVIDQFSLKKPVANIMINESTGLTITGIATDEPICLSVAKVGEGTGLNTRLSCEDLINVRNIYTGNKLKEKNDTKEHGVTQIQESTKESVSVLLSAFLDALK